MGSELICDGAASVSKYMNDLDDYAGTLVDQYNLSSHFLLVFTVQLAYLPAAPSPSLPIIPFNPNPPPFFPFFSPVLSFGDGS